MKTEDDENLRRCCSCGMQMEAVSEYHSWAVCVLFLHTQNSNEVRSGIRAVIEYGMEAQKKGASLDDAMTNVHTVR
jgi:hypothetical protein